MDDEGVRKAAERGLAPARRQDDILPPNAGTHRRALVWTCPAITSLTTRLSLGARPPHSEVSRTKWRRLDPGAYNAASRSLHVLTPGGRPMISIEELRAAAEAERRRHLRRLLALVGTMLLSMATLVTLILVFHARIRDGGPSDKQFLSLLISLTMTLATMLPCALAYWLIVRRPTRDRRLFCPHCERNLAGGSGLVLIS